MGLRIDEVDAVAHPAGVGQVGQALKGLIAVWATRATHDDQAVGLGAGGAQFGQRLDGGIGALEWLDASHEQEQAAVEGQTEGPAGLRPVARAEEGVVDAGSHDADAGGVGAVELDDLLGLDRARGQHGVGALDDGGLSFGPTVRHVGLDLFGHRFGLDPVQGMERTDERQVELMLDRVAGHAGQPVVGVDRGERAASSSSAERAVRGAHALEHALGEGVDHAGERLLGHRPRRTGGDVVYPEAGLDVEHRCEVVRPRPGEDIALHAGPGQGPGELAHIDVHATTVPGARLGQGGRVEGEDGEPAHGGQILPGVAIFPARADPGLGPVRPWRRWRRGCRRGRIGAVGHRQGGLVPGVAGTPCSSSKSRRKER